MRVSRVYKVEGNVTVLLFTNNDKNRVMNIVNESILIDPEEYKYVYIIDNDTCDTLEMNELFSDTIDDSVGPSVPNLDTIGSSLRNLMRNEPKKVIKDTGNSNVCMNMSKSG